MRIEIANQGQTKTGLCMLCKADPMSNSRRCAMCQTLGNRESAGKHVDVSTDSDTGADSALVSAWSKLDTNNTPRYLSG